MIAGLSRALIDEFYHSAADAERRKTLLRERVQGEAEQHEQDRQAKIRKDEQDREDWERLLSTVATPHEIAAFNRRLDAYDTATVETLLENRRAYDRSQERLERLHTDAFTLPDGRRVFPTIKGDEVFDESGARVGADVIDPQAIPPGKPTHEDHVSAQDERKRLEQEHRELLAFQARLDAARERTSAGDVSKKELGEIDAELKAGMPPSLAARLPQERAETPDAIVNRSLNAPTVEPSDNKAASRSMPAYRP